MLKSVVYNTATAAEMTFISKIAASLSIACDIKVEYALYSVFYAEASKIPHHWEYITLCVFTSSLCLPLAAAHYKLIKLQSQ